MAISKSFFGLRRGSTKSQTFSVLKGQQITKDRVSQVSNPKSTGQMTQRALFATAVKFYKHANQQFFRFAFEDKKQTESEYNAFMRHNLVHSTIFNYASSQNEAFPAIGDGWVLTAGSLSTPVVSLASNRVRLGVGSVEGNETTWGEVSARIISAYGLQAGDIITVVGVRSTVQSIEEEPAVNPYWDLQQYVLNPSTSAELPDLVSVADGYVTFDADVMADDACGGAVVFSRNIAGAGVKVSTSRLINNATAQNILDASRQEVYRQTALNSWGATGIAILQGSIATPIASVVKSISSEVVDEGSNLTELTVEGFTLPDSFSTGDYATVVLKQGTNTWQFNAEYGDDPDNLVFENTADMFGVGTISISINGVTGIGIFFAGVAPTATQVSITKLRANGVVLYP